MALLINFKSMEISFTNFKYSDALRKETSSVVVFSIKTLLIHLVILCGISLLVSFLFSTNIRLSDSNLSNQLLFAVIFFLLGIVHIIFFPKWIKYVTEIPLKISLIYALVFAVVLGVVIFLYFFVSNYNQPQLALVAACSFLLPLVIGIAWTCYNAINPIIEIKPWFVPIQKTTFQNRINVVNSFQIKFILKMYYFDEVTSEFDVNVAGGFRLGKIFHEFLVQNDTGDTKIQQLDYQLNPYGWVFYVKKFSGFKKLDPGLTFLDNNINENDIIIIERVNAT